MAIQYLGITKTVEVSKPEIKLGAVILLHLFIAVQDMLDEAKSDKDMSLY